MIKRELVLFGRRASRVATLGLFLLFSIRGFGQSELSAAERLQGYVVAQDHAIFVFDEMIYGVQPRRVMLEGEMRGWDHNMDDPAWALQRDAQRVGVWVLAVPNPDFSHVAPGAQFKFRVDAGEWLNVPSSAPNVKGGNLVFAYDRQPTRIRAELVAPYHVRAHISGENLQPSLTPSDYRLLRADGMAIPVAAVLRVSPTEVHLHPAQALDLTRVHELEYVPLARKVFVKFDGWFRHLYSPKELGANFDASGNRTIFRVFAPRAVQVNLHLYETPESPAFDSLAMKKDEQGIWESSVPGNVEGKYYDFTAHGPGDPGNYFYEQRPVHASDPYARVNVEAYGRSRVWPRLQPPKPLANVRPKMKDLIAYEVHVQDFTMDLPGLDDRKRGTFAGMMEPGLRNERGEKVGFDYLVDLGINAVHLMPVQEFLHYPDEEWQAAFRNDPYMIERGINMENYQWGYRISHFFALENRYRTKGTEHGAQNEQFRDMVTAFHEQGIAVILDFVFNHTAENMDGRDDVFNFKAFDAQYYYRTNDKLELVGVFGNETKSEDRPMVQRWIIDQCKFFVEEYGVDGFRIDLAGLTDKQTLLALRQVLGPDVILYGEPWIDSSDPAFQENPDWDWYKHDAPITYFDDDYRNAIHGPPSTPKSKKTDRGYAGGNGERANAKLAIAAGFPTEHTPVSGINYLDIHDDWAMADRFATSDWDGRHGVDEGPFKIAAAMLFTSLGPIVMHGGTEIMRSKGAAPLEEVTKHLKSGPIALHGKRDTYNLAKANRFVWSNAGKNIGDDHGTIKCNYKNMHAYWRGLIALRLSQYGEVCRVDKKPATDYIKWIEPANEMQLGYMIADHMLVLVNTDSTEAVFRHMQLPSSSRWQLVANDERVDHQHGIADHADSVLQQAQAIDLKVPAQSVKIWVMEK